MWAGSNKPPLTQCLCVSVSLPWSGHHPRHGCGWAVGRPCSNHPPPPETSPHPVMTGVISTISNRRQQGEGGSCLALCSFQFPSYFVSVCVLFGFVCLDLYSIWTPPSPSKFTFAKTRAGDKKLAALMHSLLYWSHVHLWMCSSARLRFAQNVSVFTWLYGTFPIKKFKLELARL